MEDKKNKTKGARDFIKEYQAEIVSSANELDPGRAADILAKTAALLGSLNDRIRVTEMAYNRMLLEAYRTEETANRAKIKAETSEEYSDKLEAQHVYKAATELIRSLKYYLRNKEDEYRQAGYQ